MRGRDGFGSGSGSGEVSLSRLRLRLRLRYFKSYRSIELFSLLTFFRSRSRPVFFFCPDVDS